MEKQRLTIGHFRSSMDKMHCKSIKSSLINLCWKAVNIFLEIYSLESGQHFPIAIQTAAGNSNIFDRLVYVFRNKPSTFHAIYHLNSMFT